MSPITSAYPSAAEHRPPVSDQRPAIRARLVPRYYSGPLHLAFTISFCLTGMAGCAVWLDRVTALEWLTIPLTFLYANLAEYLGHRGPMHRPRIVQPMYDGHMHIHHHFFPAERFAYECTDDFCALLLPPYMVVFFLGVFGMPMALLLYGLLSSNVAWLFLATALGYLLNYELLHFCYHAPEDSWPLRLPFMRRLRTLHLAHHEPRLMNRYNFNISYPLFDWLFGTIYRGRGA